MKKINNLAWMSAIALAGAMGFTACSSDDDAMENVNPSYNGESVKTQIAISLPQAQRTRQSADVTQNANAFRGMAGMTLIPLSQKPAASMDFAAASVVTLGSLQNSEISTNQSSKTYNDISIPVGTEYFLFYGEGGALSSTYTTVANKAINGVLGYDFSNIDNTNDVTFSVQSIDNASAANVRISMWTILNAVLQTTGWSSQDDGTPLKSLYVEFAKMKSASPYNVMKVMEDLYNAVAGMAQAVDASDQKTVAAAICDKIDDYFTITGNLTAGYTITDFVGTTCSSYLTSLSDANIPEGALAVEVDGSAFVVAGSASVGSNGNSVVLDNLYYPASLMYYVNTPLRASDSDADFTWPTTAGAWTTDANWNNWTSSKVLATTRKIALKDNIQYGVARLATTVKCATGGTLDDNAKLMGGATTDNKIAVPSEGFPVSAILVGGQPTQVGWEMLPTVDDNRTAVIYDSKMNATVAAKSGSAEGVNYTMVLDNAIVTSGSAQQKVNIAVELTNNSGADFYGANGLVPAGAKFYMVAQLDPTSNNGVTNVVNRVFLKDYTTTANLTIGSLKGAYVTIPDLRSTKLQLGLSVDLAWQNGLTFDVTIQ